MIRIMTGAALVSLTFFLWHNVEYFLLLGTAACQEMDVFVHLFGQIIQPVTGLSS